MKYYDIHTHQSSVHPDIVAIVNLNPVQKEFEFLSEEIQISPNTSFFSCGIHPWYINDVKRQLALLEQCLSFQEVVLLGEAGFDKCIQTPISSQEAAFLAQADLAEQFQRPIIIHCVKAWQEIVAVKNKINPRKPWIIHGFRGNSMLASQLLQQGFYLSFGNYFNSEAVRIAWPDRLFLETDDSPMDIHFIYQKIAETLSVEESSLVRQVADNVAHLGLIK